MSTITSDRAAVIRTTLLGDERLTDSMITLVLFYSPAAILEHCVHGINALIEREESTDLYLRARHLTYACTRLGCARALLGNLKPSPKTAKLSRQVAALEVLIAAEEKAIARAN